MVMSKPKKHLYEFGPFCLDVVNRILLRDGVPVPLQPKTFDLLLALVQHYGQVLEKDELMQSLWPDTIVEEANLTQNIYLLRKVFGEESGEQKYIETMPRRGYRFVAAVSEVWDEGVDFIAQQHTRAHIIVNEEEEETFDTSLESPTTVSQAQGPTARPWLSKRFILGITLSVLATSLYFIWPPGGLKQKVSNTVPPSYKQMTFTGNATSPALSPDGTFIAYVTGEKVMVQDVAGGQPIEVFQGTARRLRWSPDGSELMVMTGSEAFLVPRLGGSPRRLRGVGFACWSPDGSHIAQVGLKKIFFLNKLTGERRSINLQGSFESIADLDWSPSDSLLFLTREKATQSAIWTIRPDGTEQQKVYETNDYILSARWSGEGDVIYFLLWKAQRELWKIPIIPATGELKAPAWWC